MIQTGVIHGRFQVLHNDHLKYLLAGKADASTLVVGITNPDPCQTKMIQLIRNEARIRQIPLPISSVTR